MMGQGSITLEPANMEQGSKDSLRKTFLTFYRMVLIQLFMPMLTMILLISSILSGWQKISTGFLGSKVVKER